MYGGHGDAEKDAGKYSDYTTPGGGWDDKVNLLNEVRRKFLKVVHPGGFVWRFVELRGWGCI